jgi:uncharacterized protein (TIGR02117 family)
MFLSTRRPGPTAALFAGTACGFLASCSWTPVTPYEGTAPRTETVYVAVLGWHTEIGLRVDAIHSPLTALAREFPGARYLMFGWGQYDYYMAANPGFADALRAVIPGPAVMLVSALPHPPSETFGAANVYVIPVSPEGMDRLSDYLWGYLENSSAGRLRRVGNGPYRESAFYAAAGTYDIGNTCNTWTAEALKVSGLPVSVAGVVFASQVADQLRVLAVSGISDPTPDNAVPRSRAFLGQSIPVAQPSEDRWVGQGKSAASDQTR